MKQKLILIGASTGGPGHLKKILSALDENLNVPIILAQHMNFTFLNSFAKQFNSELPFDVLLCEKKDILEKGKIYICATHCELKKTNNKLVLKTTIEVKSHYNPCINHLFNSAIGLIKEYEVLSVLLTGIGDDGALGLSDLQKNGATCIAESEESAIVYGMPKRAKELNENIEILSLTDIINYIKRFGES